MLHIAICDDEKDFVASLTQLLEQYAAERGEKIKVTAYYDGLELLEHCAPTVDLIFLDIRMRLMDGLEAARRIRQRNENVGIIFLTTLTQYGLEGYKYQAFNYIIKPMRYVRLKAELDHWLRRHRRDPSPSIVVTNDTGTYKIALNGLRYAETFSRKLLLHTEQENIICRKSMKELEQTLADKGFARCHTSYLVNLYYVKSVRTKSLEIELLTGEVLPISQPKRKGFMERLTEYMGDTL